MNKLTHLLLLFFLISGSFVTVFISVSASDLVEDTWHTKAPMNQPRHNFGVVAVDGKIYAIGGDQLSPGVSTMQVDFNERYDPKTNKWTTLESMPTPSSGFAIVAYQGKLYCIGQGLTQVYDIASNSWSTKTSCPSNNAPRGVHVVDGKIFVILFSRSPFVGCEMYMYDTVADSWIAKTSLPTAALISSSFVLDNKLIATGTFIDPVRCQLLVYDPNSDKWHEDRTISNPIYGRANSFGVTSGLYAPQKIYVPQTLNRTAAYIDLTAFNIDIFSQNNMTELNITELSTFTRAYDPVSDTWVNGTGVPTARMTPGVVIVDDVLYVIGGLNHGMSLVVNEQYVPFGYQGNLSSRSTFSLDNILFVVALVVTVIAVVIVVVLFFFKNKRKQVNINSNYDSESSSVMI